MTTKKEETTIEETMTIEEVNKKVNEENILKIDNIEDLMKLKNKGDKKIVSAMLTKIVFENNVGTLVTYLNTHNDNNDIIKQRIIQLVAMKRLEEKNRDLTEKASGSSSSSYVSKFVFPEKAKVLKTFDFTTIDKDIRSNIPSEYLKKDKVSLQMLVAYSIVEYIQGNEETYNEILAWNIAQEQTRGWLAQFTNMLKYFLSATDNEYSELVNSLLAPYHNLGRIKKILKKEDINIPVIEESNIINETGIHTSKQLSV